MYSWSLCDCIQSCCCPQAWKPWACSEASVRSQAPLVSPSSHLQGCLLLIYRAAIFNKNTSVIRKTVSVPQRIFTMLLWDFWFSDFFIEIFKIHRLVWFFLWIFGCFESVESNEKIWEKVKKVTKHESPPPPPKDIHRPRPMDLKIYSLERNLQLWLDNWRSLENFEKIISVTSISV